MHTFYQPNCVNLGDQCKVTKSRFIVGSPRQSMSSDATAREHNAAHTATHPAKSPL